MKGFGVIFFLLVAGATESWAQDNQTERITFFYYSQQNPEDPQQMRLDDPNSINSTYFDAKKPTMVLIHGFMENVNFTQLADLRIIYVGYFDHNVISVNYDGYKQSDGDIYTYYQNVGQYVGKFIRYLMDSFELKPDDLQIIGHSVGVHVAGEAGKSLKNDRLVRRITGLDPANWKDMGQTSMDIIRPGDAKIVDCIHTSTSFGIHTPICKCNYYVHGGTKQPECLDANEIGQLIGLCDHLSAFRYYQKSIMEPQKYPGYECTTVESSNVKNCSTTATGFLGVNQDQYCEKSVFNVIDNLNP